jgi:RNA polymerase sigma factor (sigma-70 family)
MKWWNTRLQAPLATENDIGLQRAAVMTSEELARIFVDLRPNLERVITRRIGDAQAAQDLAQDLYIRFRRVAHQLPNDDEARRYLMRMATNAAIDHLRVEGNRVQLLAGALSLFEGHVAEPEHYAHAEDRCREIDGALEELPDKCRDVLYLSRIEGLTHVEIAERLGVTVSLVEKYAVLAVRHCRKRVAKL